jgi:hypothetical protein
MMNESWMAAWTSTKATLCQQKQAFKVGSIRVGLLKDTLKEKMKQVE